MNRRESFKTLLVGAVAGATIGTTTACKTDPKDATADTSTTNNNQSEEYYGRTPSELEHDAKIYADEYLNEYELGTIAVLCDIILPASATAGSATEA